MHLLLSSVLGHIFVKAHTFFINKKKTPNSNRSPKMNYQVWRLALVVLTGSYIIGVRSQRTVSCPASGIQGYDSISAINDDMQQELQRIMLDGENPLPSYSYILCPDTTFDGATTLLPVLNEITFLCGEGGLARTCVIAGGTQQVLISESIDPTYPLENITFVGFSFSNFNGTSISAYATNVTMATFEDCAWTVSKEQKTQFCIPIDRFLCPTSSLHNRTGLVPKLLMLFIRRILQWTTKSKE